MFGQMTRAMSVFSVTTLFSRVLGYVRDATIFILFGATGATDAFLVAFRLPNFLRRMFAEGAFLQAFVPVLSEYKTRGPQEVQALINRSAGTLGLLLLIISVVGILAAPLLILFFAPGFYASDAQLLASDMLRITFPYILFVSLTALAAGVLNVYHHYAIPAFSPALLNLCLIAAAIGLAPHMEQPIMALAWGVLFAGVLQLLAQVGFLHRLGYQFRFVFAYRDPGVRRIAGLMLPGILGASVVQLNLLIDTMIASFLVSGSISWLYISDRFVELPNGLFGVAIATVLLAYLSNAYAANRTSSFCAALNWAGTMTWLLALPSMLGLILLAEPILTAFVQYREFSEQDTQMAYRSLIAYALGLPAFMLVKILSAGFFSRQRMRIPVKMALYALAVNFVLNLSFVGLWVYMDWRGPHTGLALATALASWFNCLCLYRALKHDGYQMVLMFGVLKKSLVATILMSFVLWLLIGSFEIDSLWPAWGRIGFVAAAVFAGSASYFLVLFLLGLRPGQLMAPAGESGEKTR